MSSTDDRIVRMQFDNAQFKRGAAETQKSLADLNSSIDSAGKSKGLLDVSKQMGTVAVSASKMQVVTTAAIATIATKATLLAGSLAKALTFEPVSSGFLEYEALLTKQNTIMNATGKSAQEVKKVLNDLNHYSDQTIYNFANMTTSITKFVNAGVPLEKAAETVKGIANAAAFAGASTEDANRAMFAFSQSIANGFLTLGDFNQIEAANMATVQFKESLLEAAVAAGTLNKEGNKYITASGERITATQGFQYSLQEQWATTEVLNGALAKYTDLGTKLGRQATESATEVRTFTAFLDTLKESIASGWASIFTALIGNLQQATKFWTGLADAVGGGVGSIFKWLNAMLTTWRELGGFEKTIQGWKNLLSPLAAIFDAIGTAFRAAFPNSGDGSGKALYGLSFAFEAITRPLQILADVIRGTTPILTVFFQVLKIGGTLLGRLVGDVIDFAASLVGLADVKPSGGFLDFIKDLGQAIADAVDEIDELISKGASLSEAFGSVGFSLPDMPDVGSLPSMPSLSGIFGGDSGGEKTKGEVASVTDEIKGLTTQVLDLNDASDAVGKTALFDPSADTGEEKMGTMSANIGAVVDEAKKAPAEIDGFVAKMGAAFGAVTGFIGDFIKGMDFEKLMAAFNTGVFATMALTLNRFLNALTGFIGIGAGFSSVLEGAGDALKSFQTAARAKLILNIAIAVAILAASLLVLSLIPADKMKTALTGLAGAVGSLGILMLAFSKTMESLDVKGMGFKMIALGVAMVALATSLLILSGAFIIMSKTDWDGVLKGLVTMTVLLGGLTVFGKFSAATAPQLLGGAVAILAIGVAMAVLAGALLLFKMVDWKSMAKAGVTLAAVALAIGLLSLIPYGGIALVGAAMLMASLGMVALANALILFGLVKWSSIGKGAVMLGALALSLALIMAAGGPASAAAIVAISAAMVGLALAGLLMNSVDWSSIAKVGLMLLVLVLGLGALLAVLTVFAPAVLVLLVFAAALLALGVALAAFSAAMAIALTIAAAGTAAFAAFATGAAVAIAVFLQTLAAEVPVMKQAILDILQGIIDGIVEAVPMVIDGFKRLWAAVKAELTDPSKKETSKSEGKSWVSKIADGIMSKLPEIVDRGIDILLGFIRGVRMRADELAAEGVLLVASVIDGIAKRVDRLITAGANLVIAFMVGIGKQVQPLAQAGFTLIITFLNALAATIRANTAALVGAFFNLGTAVVQGLIDGIQEKTGEALGAIKDLAGALAPVAGLALEIFSPSRVFRRIGRFLVDGLTLGIQDHAANAISAVARMMTGTIAMSETLMDAHIQRMDQKALAARARAAGLSRAAAKAARAANKTKGKEDDKSAKRLAKEARQADRQADKAEKAVKQKIARDRYNERWEKASNAQRAKIRSNEAQNALLGAKQAELNAEAARVEARELEKRAKAAGLTKEQRKQFRKQAAELRKEAEDQAKLANRLLETSRKKSLDAIKFQKLSGEEAAEQFQKLFDEEKKADEDAEAFEKKTAAEKAAIRRQEAAEMQKLADENLEKAKKLAFTDLNAANKLAELALEQAEKARQLTDEAEQFEEQGGSGQVVDLQPTEAAALAFNQYADLYDSAMAAAARTPTVEFNQYNTSPEALDATTIYRQSNNLVTFAADKLQPAA